tara:strand:- start:394 stop:657 length:264 start_codon:yes stop_codon:yes gene_type:complete
MIFKPGNLVKLNSTGGLYLVLDAEEISKKLGRTDHKGEPLRFLLELRVMCVMPGNSQNVFAGEDDTYFFRERDGSDGSHRWSLINAV